MGTMQTTDEITKEAARLEEDVLYAEKQHFSMATVWSAIHFLIGLPSAVLAALAGVKAISEEPQTAAILAVASAALTALLTFLDPAKKAAYHHNAGVLYSSIRGRLRRYRLLDIPDGKNADTLRAELEDLAGEKNKLMQSSPHIGGLAYFIAKSSIERRQHEHIVDA